MQSNSNCEWSALSRDPTAFTNMGGMGSYMDRIPSQMSTASFAADIELSPTQLDPSPNQDHFSHVQWPIPYNYNIHSTADGRQPSKAQPRHVPAIVVQPQDFIDQFPDYENLDLDPSLSQVDFFDTTNISVFPEPFLDHVSAIENSFSSYSSSESMSRSASGATYSSMGSNTFSQPSATDMERSSSNMSNISFGQPTVSPFPSSFLPTQRTRHSAPSLSHSLLAPPRMKRSASNQSHVSRPSLPTRSIRPKATSTVEATSTPDMIRVKSSDGTSKSYGVLSRQPETGSVKPAETSKIRCKYCNEYPLGFRGEHELQRHTNLRHQRRRKVWICIDASEDGAFLSKCKSCRDKKEYGAYYNAAAHLRRIHFHPRKRGRKSKKDSEKRGGKAGGDWPAMELLKENWMREIEVVNSGAPLSTSETDSSADADGEAYQEGHEEEPRFATGFDDVVSTPYPSMYFGVGDERGPVGFDGSEWKPTDIW